MVPSDLSGHPSLEVAYWISQIAAAIAQCLLILITVWAGFVAYSQATAFKLFELLKYAQDENFRESRRVVIREIGPKKGTDWWRDERLENMASNCCAHYDVLGRVLLISGKRSMGRFFATNWADSIIRTYEILDNFMETRRSSGGNDYRGYIWLYKTAKKSRER